MTNSQDRGDSVAGPGPAKTRRLRWWVSGITFVVGVVVGIIAVGLLSVGTPDFGSDVGPGGRTAPNPTLAPTPGGSVPPVAEARVNAACLAVINGAQDTFTVLSGVEEAVTDVDLQQLDDIVRQLQPIQTRLGRDLEACEIDTSVDPQVTEGARSPTPQPTVSPTR